MNKFVSTVIALAAAASAYGGSGVSVTFPGTNNTLVRLEKEGKYLVMPVQESNDEATVNVLVDGRLERTIYVRLAKSKVDYTVPLDIEKYKGHDVILNVVTSQNRATVREAKDDACWSNFAVCDTFDVSNHEKFRPAFHHTPSYGWMNDPNGLFYKDGEWHLYYQWNPYGSKWQNMTWGHSTSSDLITWTHHPAAIEPNGLGTVFSGNAAIDKDGSAGFGKDAVVALYTSAGVSQIQSMAVSKDNGYTFDIYSGNPVLCLESEARDPNIFRDPKTGVWTMVLAHPLDHEMLIFTSSDMKEWSLQSSFGKGLGAQDGVWECPDLFELPVEGSNERKWVLICNLNPGGPFGGSATQYFTGDFDGKAFKVDTDASGNVPLKWLDYGKDHYATISFSDAPDGRRTLLGWMSNWQYAAEVPTMQFRSANTLPREASLFRDADGEMYVSVVPSPEVEALRGSLVGKARKVSVGTKAKSYAIPELCEICLDINPLQAKTVELELGNARGEKVIMRYTPSTSELSFDRTQSGIVDFSQDFPSVTVAPTHNAGGKLGLRIFIDRSSIEVFECDGRFAMTNIVFPNEPYSTLTVKADGGKASISNLKIYSLKSK